MAPGFEQESKILQHSTLTEPKKKNPNVKTYLICIRSCAWCFRLCFIHFALSLSALRFICIENRQTQNTSKAGLYGFVG